MVLGLKAKIRRGPTVQLDYLIHVQEIKPWPPSQSLKNIRSVLIQWENGKRSSGTTNTVVPSVNDGQIQFNESFKLSVTLSRDMSIKNGDIDVFHKNLLEFNLFEPRRDTTVKGQLLGTANVDLSDYGILNEITSINVPVNCTRSFRNTIQPVLYIRIQPVDKGRSSSSSRGSLAKEASLDKNGRESASKLMKDYVEEGEVASFTDDDASSHSSHTASSNGGRSSQNDEKQNNGTSVHKAKSIQRRNSNSSQASSLDLSSEPGSPHNLPASIPNATGVGPKIAPENIISHGVQSSTSFANGSSQGIKKTVGNQEGRENSQQEPHIATTMDAKLNFANDNAEPQSDEENEEKSFKTGRSAAWYRTTSEADDLDDKDGDYVEQNGGLRLIMEEKRNSFGESSNRFSQHPIRNQALSASDILLTGDLQKPVKSVWPSVESARTNGSIGVNSTIAGRRDARVYPLEKRSISSDSKIEELEQRIQMLEGELREAAAIEVSLYSVVAEHGSSVSKVHAPARRLSRLYLRASRDKSNLRRASAARSAVSGLAVVSKACGNDVPRLTFWLSNCVVLRAIITETFVEQLSSVSAGHSANRNGLWNVTNKKSPKLMWKASSSGKKGSDSSTYETLDDWNDPDAFTSALQKVESWIFLRIVESVWWQTLTPHMQSSAAKVVDKSMDSASKKSTRRMSSSSGQDQVNLSLELWKKAFKDACERLCPVRASGHECGCLSVLAKLIMEQCVARLDVAMFNAILRESADDIPTDPLSDPISDALVLPIPSGKSSFGAGAQLKNAIGNWSRILTDLFGMDDDEPFVDENEDRDDDDDGEKQFDSSFKSFHLLKSLSDLMMLPKDMLLNSSVRKEVCPTFSPHLIRRILNNFVQDEFCPDPIPDALFEALDSEEAVENDEGPMMHFPCKAAAAVYSPPSASSLAAVIGDLGSPADLRRSRSLLKKSNTSDDELDELDSPLSLIADGNLQRSPAQSRQMWNGQENDCQNGIRYQLLREIWTTSD